MKTIYKPIFFIALATSLTIGCGDNKTDSGTTTETKSDLTTAGQSAVTDDLSQKNVVQVAVGSPDHTTLVTAVTTAGLVDVLSNVGPFTVFAPVNAAFDALPAGTVENLLKPENKSTLSNILEYHVYIGVIRESMMQDGMVLNQANGDDITLSKTEEGIKVNGAKIMGTVVASNGIVYVIDKVLLPPDKK
jgi:uncharacterized surface protein with fasciclin (FAS1) repeats